MHLIEHLVHVVAVLLILGSISSVDGACVKSYEGLRYSLFARRENVDRLKTAFFPIGEEPSVSIEIKYFFHNWTMRYPLMFRWSESFALGFIRPELLRGLTLRIFNKMPPLVNLVVDPPCDDPNLHSSLSDWESLCYRDDKIPSTTLYLLNELTTNVSYKYIGSNCVKFCSSLLKTVVF